MEELTDLDRFEQLMESFGQSTKRECCVYDKDIVEVVLYNDDYASYYSTLIFNKNGKFIKEESFDV